MCENIIESRRSVRIPFAMQLLQYFVSNSNEHYGSTFCVYSVHGLTHIADDVEYYNASLDSISAFSFENY